MPDPITLPKVPTPSRWTLVVTPLPNGEASSTFATITPGVTRAEVARSLARLAATYLISPFDVLPTEQEAQAYAARIALVKEHPATRLFARSGETVWVGDTLPEAIVTHLALAGWIDVGPVPVDAVRPCDYCVDPAAFEKKCAI